VSSNFSISHAIGSHSQASRPQSGQHVMSASDISEHFKALTCLWEKNRGVGRACFVNLLLNSIPVTQRSVLSNQWVADQCHIIVSVFKRPCRKGLGWFSPEIYRKIIHGLTYLKKTISQSKFCIKEYFTQTNCHHLLTIFLLILTRHVQQNQAALTKVDSDLRPVLTKKNN